MGIVKTEHVFRLGGHNLGLETVIYLLHFFPFSINSLKMTASMQGLESFYQFGISAFWCNRIFATLLTATTSLLPFIQGSPLYSLIHRDM